MTIINPTDRSVGRRLKERRRALGLSQKALAARVNLTWQQIRKYEQGANRIGAGRLYDFATILHVPIRYFFEDTEIIPDDFARDPEAVRHNDLVAFAESKEGQTLLVTFQRIKNAAVRRDLIKLIRALSE